MGALLSKRKKGHMKINEPIEEEDEDEEEENYRVYTYSAKNEKKFDQMTQQNEQAKAKEQASSLNRVEGVQAVTSSSQKPTDGS